VKLEHTIISYGEGDKKKSKGSVTKSKNSIQKLVSRRSLRDLKSDSKPDARLLLEKEQMSESERSRMTLKKLRDRQHNFIRMHGLARRESL
jgi:hypothetical protein